MRIVAFMGFTWTFFDFMVFMGFKQTFFGAMGFPFCFVPGSAWSSSSDLVVFQEYCEKQSGTK